MQKCVSSKQNNMGVSTFEVSSFEIHPGSVHTMMADSGLSLMTVKIEHLTSSSNVVLNRPDGIKHMQLNIYQILQMKSCKTVSFAA
jgi:hypothetical protein